MSSPILESINLAQVLVAVLALVFVLMGYINWYVAGLFMLTTFKLTWRGRS